MRLSGKTERARFAGVRLGAAALCAAALAASVLLGGCVFSETITEIIYEQDEAYEIDPSADPVLVNSPTARLWTEELPSLSVVDEGANDPNDRYTGPLGNLAEALESNPQKGEGRAEDDVEAQTPDNSQAETGEGNQRSDDVEATDQVTAGDVSQTQTPAAGDEGNDAARSDAGEDGRSGEGGTVSEDQEGDDPGGETPGKPTENDDEPQGDEDDQGGNGGEPENTDDPEDGSGPSRTPGSVFDEAGAYSDLPEGVKRIGAVGDAAVVVAALGGADGKANLVAVDAELYGGRAADVLSERGFAEADVGWSGDGTEAGDAMLDTLLSLELDAVLITEGDETLTGDELDALMQDGANIVYVPRMTTADRSRACVQRIATLLAKGGDSMAAGLASDYDAFVGSIIDIGDTASQDLYTVYVSDWMTGIGYQGQYSDQLAVNAAAFAAVGEEAESISTYLEYAHVKNTATKKPRYGAAEHRAIVWPLMGGTNDWDWTGVTDVNGGLETTGSGFGLALTRFAPSNSYYYDLGTVEFPAMIVRTAEQQKAVEDSRDSGGLYSAAAPVSTSIATDYYSVYVNPCGMMGSWIDGSFEGILETAWAYSLFQAQDGGSYLGDQIVYLYGHFYGHSLSEDELLAIAYGDYAE